MFENYTYICIALFGGFINKLYDDLHDNDRLMQYSKNAIFNEFIKGIHYICFTALSLYEPTFFVVFYLINLSSYIFSMYGEWSSPYEYSLIFSYVILFLLIDYNKIKSITYNDLIFSISTGLLFVLEPYFIPEEYSLRKFLHRIFVVLYCIFFLFFTEISNFTLYFVIYGIGYMLFSTFVQYYSVFIHKEDPIKDETIKEDLTKEETTKEDLTKEETTKEDLTKEETTKETNV